MLPPALVNTVDFRHRGITSFWLVPFPKDLQQCTLDSHDVINTLLVVILVVLELWNGKGIGGRYVHPRDIGQCYLVAKFGRML